MNKYKLYGGIASGVVLLIVAITGMSTVFAGEDEVAKIRARVAQLKEEMARNSREYNLIAASIVKDRSHCELAASKEVQLSKLQGSNAAKRTEQEILLSLLSDKDSAIKSPLAAAPR